MGWERRGGRTYCYRAARVDGRVVKEYVPLPLAEASAAVADDRRALRAAEAEAVRRARAVAAGVDRQMDDLDAVADRLAEAALLAAGFRRHHRGEWRKRRGDATGPAAAG